MSGDHDLGGDYGYDMVQEAATATWVTQQRRPVNGVMGAAMEPSGDYCYDQAHE